MSKRVLARLFRPLIVRLAWWLTTHDGFYSPCDDDHCIEVRSKARGVQHQLPAVGQVAALQARIDRLRFAIRDLDAHSTPLGGDADGFVAIGYAVSLGAMHRALAAERQ